MIADEIRDVLKKRLKLHPDDDFATEACWKEEVEILSRSVSDTIVFLTEECTEEEFSWISEIFEDLAEQTKSREFVQCLYDVAGKYPKETEKYHILYSIQCGENRLEEC